MCYSSTRPGTSLHVTQFYQVFPHISTASEKHWGEKYEATSFHDSTLLMYRNYLCNASPKGHTNGKPLSLLEMKSR